MNSDVVVFLGPSLPCSQAVGILPEAEYRPPIQRGDIDALLARPPKIVGIIDGQFFQGLAVSPKEVLRGLKSGIKIFGASSMGALRAAELCTFGMIGVGSIFNMYLTGKLDADDEVAMVYSASSLEGLSVPMVNIRYAFAEAAALGLITKAEKRLLIDTAKRLYFSDRTYAGVLSLVGGKVEPARRAAFARYLKENPPDLKAIDARVMLREIATSVEISIRRACGTADEDLAGGRAK